MKKIFALALLGLAIVTVTSACGSKKAHCEAFGNDQFVKVTQSKAAEKN
jgi:ABC-type glycerol-3-phosphate transport system substrate-binding protein